MGAFAKGIEGLALGSSPMVTSHKGKGVRRGVDSRMSPLSSLGIPGAGKYVNYSVPMGGLGSLKGMG